MLDALRQTTTSIKEWVNNKFVVDNQFNINSTNPVQNSVVTDAINKINTTLEEIAGGDISIDNIVLPNATEADEGKVLMIVNGKWQMVKLVLSVDENGAMFIGHDAISGESSAILGTGQLGKIILGKGD